MTPRFGCVVLTTGSRPADLRRALDSLLAQEGVETDIVVVGNGWEPEGLPPGVRGVGLAEDRGIPGGRNAGVPHTTGELLFFLDDDAALEQPDALASIAQTLNHPPKRVRHRLRSSRECVGLVQLRVEARGEGSRSRDWVPRLRTGDPARSSDVAALWEGAVGVPRALFEQVGGWPADFRFVHEGVGLAWRVLDAGWRVRYVGERSVSHPPPGRALDRHGYSTYYGARNRVWLARRHLPLPLGAAFVASFALRTLPQLRTPEQRRAALRGYRDGLRGHQPRQRLRARTLWRMTRSGRPPIL